MVSFPEKLRIDQVDILITFDIPLDTSRFYIRPFFIFNCFIVNKEDPLANKKSIHLKELSTDSSERGP